MFVWTNRSETMQPSPRSLKYFEALCSEGDSFNRADWLKRVREEEACERDDASMVGEKQSFTTLADVRVPVRQSADHFGLKVSNVGLCRPAASHLRVRDRKPTPRSTQRNLLKGLQGMR